MAASTKKQVIAIFMTSSNVTASNCAKNGGSAVTKTGMAVAPTSLVTPAALAAVFGSSAFLADPANIEAVANISTSGSNRLLVARLAPMPVTDTLSFGLTLGATPYVGQVIDVQAFSDAGLLADAEQDLLTAVFSALQTAMN